MNAPHISCRQIAELTGQEQYQLLRWSRSILVRNAARKRRLAVRECMERARHEQPEPY